MSLSYQAKIGSGDIISLTSLRTLAISASFSGIRVGTPAITTRGVKEDKMAYIVELIDRVLRDPENEAEIAKVRKEVNEMMSPLPIFAW